MQHCKSIMNLRVYVSVWVKGYAPTSSLLAVKLLVKSCAPPKGYCRNGILTGHNHIQARVEYRCSFGGHL